MNFSRPLAWMLAALIVAAIGALAWRSLARLETAPQVTYTLLDGQRVSSDDLRGKVVLVNFWATSCVTCVKEMPQIAATHLKFRDRGYETMAVAMSYDPPAFVARFAETRQLPFAVVIDNTGEIAQRFGDVRLTPTTFLINRRGEIVKRYVGEPDFAALHVLVEQLLAADAPAG
ncbi:MAG: TlpA disulfide reductase family protein [Gammaproteobacteria bacterium]